MTTRQTVTIQSPEDRQRIANWARNVDLGTIVEFRKKTRSHEQNAKLHAMLGEVSSQVVWYGQKLKVEDWKNMFSASLRKAQVVPGIDPGTVVPLGIHTSTMTIDEMSNMIELIYHFGAQPEHPVTFKDPNTEDSEAPPPRASDEDDAPRPVASSAPADEPSLLSAGAVNPGYEGKDLLHLNDFADKALKEARSGSSEGAKLQFLGSMYAEYRRDALKSAAALAALDKMNAAMEGVMTGERNAAVIEAWMKSKFLTEVNENG